MERERRLVHVGQSIQAENRKNTRAAFWIALSILAAFIAIPFSKNNTRHMFSPGLRFGSFCIGLVALLGRAIWKLSHTSLREQPDEWYHNLYELLGVIVVILFFVVILASVQGPIRG